MTGGQRPMAMAARILLLGLVAVASLGCSRSTGSVTYPTAEERRQPPYAEGVVVGEEYEDYVLYTHCGVTHAEIDGTYWEAAPSQADEASPPAGWGNPLTKGTLTIENDDTATFESGDVAARFRRADAEPPPCD